MGRRASFSSAMIVSNCLSPSRPCAATIPSSAKCARNTLITWVCCRNRRSRARCCISRPCCSADFGRTNRILGPPPHNCAPRPANLPPYCLPACCLVFVALDVSFHILRRHQPNLVAELRQLTCPVVRGGTGLHANEARRQSLEKRNHLAAPELLPDDDLLGRIDAVDLKHVLGDIQTDCGNLHVDGSLM